MKKKLLLLVVLFMFISCGPHRMGCGARGICNTSQDLKPVIIKKNSAVYLNTNPKPIRLG